MHVDPETARKIAAEIRKKYVGKPRRYRELMKELQEYQGLTLEWCDPWAPVESDDEFVVVTDVYKFPWTPKTMVRVTICPLGTKDEDELKVMLNMPMPLFPDEPHFPDVDEAAKGGYFSF